ncbi:MAG TPA: type II secretion system F family protein [Thermoguttaceae bacterium]|nr:type II secretion system F family protein [Thermoguttaceae bacterium]
MPKYRYQATDAQGKPVSGEVEAAGPDDARRKLADQGLDAERARLTEIAETVAPVSGGGRLSAEEAVEVGSQLAELAKAGLPLGPGLRAMAEEIRLLMRGEKRRLVWLSVLTFGLGALVLLPFYLASTSRRRRVARALERLADQLDAGTSLSAALEAQGRRFPRHVRGLILAGIQTGRLPEALEEFVAVEGARIELRRQVWLALAYPCVLVVALATLFLLAFTFLVPQFGKIFEEFDAELPFATEMLLWQAGPGFWVVIGVPVLAVAALVCLAFSRGAVWLRRVLYAVPLVGPVWRWAGLFNFSRLMALLVGQQVPLPTALRLTATGLRESDLAAACREAAEEVEAGRSLSECCAEFWQFPPSLRPLVAWGEQTSNPAAAFRAAAEMFDSRVRVGVTMLHAVLPPIVFVLIIAGVFSLVGGLFMPLISLIQNLT